MSPGLALGALFVAIGATATRVLIPGRMSLVVTVALAAAGALCGELLAIAAHAGGPTLGGLHPVAEGAGMLVAELLGVVLAPRRRGIP